MIPVTKPFLPPREEYERYLNGIWERNWLTNDGPLVNELEQQLKEYLGISHLLYTGNGTIALQLAIKALGLTGEIITTPFSYVATTSSIVWEGCTPVFVDINPQTCNIDPQKIEDAITPRTSAILATHVYGIPCDVEAIATIARQHNLKVIYDAAHAFGTMYKGRSLFSYGDISTTSFHATKLFHTVEGGAVMTEDPELHMRMTYMRNFGHDGPERFNGVGINAKNSEFHAAMGLAILPHMDEILARRKNLWNMYQRLLSDLPIEWPGIQSESDYEPNRAYMALFFQSEQDTIELQHTLEIEGVGTRRYFYPLLSDLDYTWKNNDLPIAESLSNKVLCLPLYHELLLEQIEDICKTISKVRNIKQ